MSDVLIIGGGGMVGQKLAASLGNSGLKPDDKVTLVDIAFPESGGAPGEQVTGDLTDPATLKPLIAKRPRLI
ncbi:MAG: NAD-dependent epimerase, partial [Pseudomonadota bacterium]